MPLLYPVPRLLIFDMDGTFMDSRAFHTKVFHRFINEYIQPIDLESTRQRMGDTVRHILCNAGVTSEQMPGIYEKLTDFCTHNIDDLISGIGLVDGIHEALDHAHGCGLRCVLLTNSMDCVARKMLEYHHLAGKFDQISGADLDSMDKINRCEAIIRANHCTPEQTICIGDAEPDIEMANAVGCRSCFVKTPTSWYKDERYILQELRPTYVVTALEQIPAAFYRAHRRIQTVAGAVDPDAVGFCQCHEHILLQKGTSWEVNPALCMDEPEKSLQELLAYRAAGGCALVDAQPVGCGRMARELETLSARSGVAIISSTGFHKLCFYPEDHWIHAMDEAALSELFISELTEGMYLDCDQTPPRCRSSVRSGIIKSALDAGAMSPEYEKLFRAAARAQTATGAPLMVHIESGSDPIGLFERLRDWGVAPSSMIFCHMDRACADLKVHEALLSQGIYLEFDTIGRFKYHSDEHEIQIFFHLIRCGFEDQLLFSLDTTRARMRHYTPDGIGLDYILRVFLPKMREAGIPESAINKISGENSRKALSYSC